MVVVDGVEMVDVREAARIAQRTPETIRRWVWAGRLPAHRHGNRLLLRRSDVMALLRPARASEAESWTLAEWAEQARRQRASAGVPGASAADLVLGDRRGRDDGDGAP
jgi:excisionase family DNA binding protein